MRAFITSIGEPTTELAKWSLERQGLEVEVVKGDDSFNAKLEYIYHEADDDFIRMDADVIANQSVSKLVDSCPDDIWWLQSMSFDWWQQNIGYAGVQYIKKQCLPILRQHIGEVQHLDRPESLMYRLPEFHNPRRCESSTIVCGLHGWGQNDTDRVEALKRKRKQIDNYDFELARRLNEFQTT